MAKRKRSSKRRPRIGRRARQAELLLARAQTLIDQDELIAALEVLEQAESALHDNLLYHALRSTALGRLGYYVEAADHAEFAAGLAPEEPALQALLAMALEGAGLFALAYQARRAWERLDPLFVRNNLNLSGLDEAYRAAVAAVQPEMGLDSFEAVHDVSLLLDQAQWFLLHEEWDDAALDLQRALDIVPDWVSARNNLSMCLYYMGEFAQAVAEIERILADYDPDDIHALSNLLRYRVAQGHNEQAQALADRLVALPLAEDFNDVFKMVEALSFLDRDKDVAEFVRRYAEREGEAPVPLLRLQGIAVANLGPRSEAMALLQQVQEMEPEWLVEKTLDALQAGRQGRGLTEHFSSTTYIDWLPGEALENLLSSPDEHEDDEEFPFEAWHELAERFPQVIIGFRKMLYEEYADKEKSSVDTILKTLAIIGTPRACEVLRDFAADSRATVQERVAALRCLRYATGLVQYEPLEVQIDGEPGLVQPSLQKIVYDYEPDYPEEVVETYLQAFDAHVQGDLAAAEAGYLQVLQRVPEFKEAYSNLATIVDARGEHELADDYLRRALEVDPNYPYARLGLAKRAFDAGDLYKAREILQPLFALPELHEAAFSRLQQMLAWIAQAEGDVEAAEQYLETAREFDPDT